MQNYLQIEKGDTLIVALTTITKGSVVSIDEDTIEIKQDIPPKHKFSITDLEVGDKVTMYGVTVGEAMKPIGKGELITTSNLKHATSEYSDRSSDFIWDKPKQLDGAPVTFQGIRRPDGKVGTANFWIVVPLVFCSNRELQLLKDSLVKALGYGRTNSYEQYAQTMIDGLRAGDKLVKPDFTLGTLDGQESPLFENIDGLTFLEHSLGCGNTPEDIDSLISLLAGYITHPNVAGATVLSLGCQKAELADLKEAVGQRDPDGFKIVQYFERQAWAGPGDMMEDAIFQILEGMQEADKVQREDIDITELTIGVECGGSDGFSGISANPVIGRTVDHLVREGGGAILSEFPELCGVENELVNRCINQSVSSRFMELLTGYRKRVQQVGSDFDLNPSPGNIRDGLITDAMKSAGAAKKGGTSPVEEVLDYSETKKSKGLTLLCTPGSDVESVTALVGAGANLVLFSTGLGTPTGNPIVPVLKIATNSEMAGRLEYMIDFNTGPVIAGEQSVDQMAADLWKMCVDTASGVYEAKASRLGQEDFIPWKRGVSL